MYFYHKSGVYLFHEHVLLANNLIVIVLRLYIYCFFYFILVVYNYFTSTLGFSCALFIVVTRPIVIILRLHVNRKNNFFWLALEQFINHTIHTYIHFIHNLDKATSSRKGKKEEFRILQYLKSHMFY